MGTGRYLDPMSGPASMSRLFLIDGYALIYRAFFAMINRPLRTSRGENTSAVWGVATFLQRLLDEQDPVHIAWVHDAGSSFRTGVYPDYKATRQKLDDELQEDFDASVVRIRELLEALGVPLVVVDGYEADDVIGTLAAQAVEWGMSVVIVSGDKDFYQLIGPQVSLLNPGRRGPASVEAQWVTEENATERLGVTPERVVDYLALVGDSSDNVPGVRGVGDKTARVLIDAYGDLDAILAHAAEVTSKKTREALERSGDAARLSRELVTIRRDVPLRVDRAGLARQPADAERLRRLYGELEFQSLLRAEEARPPDVEPTGGVLVVKEVSEVLAAVAAARSAEIIALDTETTDRDPMRADLVGMSLALPDGRTWYLPFAHRTSLEVLERSNPVGNLPALTTPSMRPMVDLLQDPEVPKAGHNVKYDWLVLRRAGVELRGVTYDSMLASFILEPGRRSHALDALVADHLGRRMTSFVELVGKGKNARPFPEVPIAAAAAYCGADSRAVLDLRAYFAPRLQECGLDALLTELDVPLIGVLVDMEWRGIAVDTAGLAVLSRRFGEELVALEADIHREAGVAFNINSTAQLRHVLFEKMNLPVLKKTKTGASSDADVLGELAVMGFALPRLLLEYRELSKLRSTYVDVLPERVHPDTRRIHTSFSQVAAATGRLSSSEPNLQNIPVRTARGEEIRRCVVPAPGRRFIVADYSQIELRLLAHMSGDEAFLAAFARGADIHRETAAIIFGLPVDAVTSEMRARAKTINFATIYGQGAFALSRQLGVTQDEAREFIRLYFERFAGVRRFLDSCIEQAKERGYVETIFGRRRYVPELQDRNYNVRAFGERVAMNSPLQGSAADLIKRAMLALDSALRGTRVDGGMVLQVHDELVLEVPQGEVERVAPMVRRAMEGAAELRVPLLADIGVGGNWLEAKA
jgi:DNA polymerase-1